MGDSAMCSRFGTIGTPWLGDLDSDQDPATVDVLREIANLRGSRGTLLEHSPVADSQSNGFFERGIRSVEERTRVILFDPSSRGESHFRSLAGVSVDC